AVEHVAPAGELLGDLHGPVAVLATDPVDVATAVTALGQRGVAPLAGAQLALEPVGDGGAGAAAERDETGDEHGRNGKRDEGPLEHENLQNEATPGGIAPFVTALVRRVAML